MSEKKRRGFASMDPEKLRGISQKGGLTGPRHVFTHEEAVEAGRKGGRHMFTHEEAVEAGRKSARIRKLKKGGVKHG